MNNKKMIAVFIALGMTMMCFSGCSLTEESTSAPTAAPSPQATATAVPIWHPLHRRQQQRQRQRQPLHRNLLTQALRAAPVHSPEAAAHHRQEAIPVTLHQEAKQRKNMKFNTSVEM